MSSDLLRLANRPDIQSAAYFYPAYMYDFDYEQALVRKVQCGGTLNLETTEWSDRYEGLAIGNVDSKLKRLDELYKKRDAARNKREASRGRCSDRRRERYQARRNQLFLERELSIIEQQEAECAREAEQRVRDDREMHPIYTEDDVRAWKEQRRKDFLKLGLVPDELCF